MIAVTVNGKTRFVCFLAGTIFIALCCAGRFPLAIAYMAGLVTLFAALQFDRLGSLSCHASSQQDSLVDYPGPTAPMAAVGASRETQNMVLVDSGAQNLAANGRFGSCEGAYFLHGTVSTTHQVKGCTGDTVQCRGEGIATVFWEDEHIGFGTSHSKTCEHYIKELDPIERLWLGGAGMFG